MNIDYRKPLPNAGIDFFDTREAVDAIEPGAYAKLPCSTWNTGFTITRRSECSTWNKP